MIPAGGIGGVLGSDEISRRLEAGELFRPDSWTPDNIRAAAYDLRIANDLLIVPDPEQPRGRRYDRGEYRTRPAVLKPGDVAFVSTRERLSMPWDVAANVGIKFGFARSGVLVLTGLLIDPGFGLKRTRDGNWVPKADERLHFVLINLGEVDFVINPGVDRVASLQFIRVLGDVTQTYVPSGSDIDREFFSEEPSPITHFALFNQLRQLQAKTTRDLEDYRLKLTTIDSATSQVVVFGVYLLAVSITVAAIAAILTLLGSDRGADAVRNIRNALPGDSRWPTAIVVAAVFLGLTFLAKGVLDFLGNLVLARARSGRNRTEGSAQSLRSDAKSSNGKADR
jgi:deoxycytidine triphosphate deaminase